MKDCLEASLETGKVCYQFARGVIEGHFAIPALVRRTSEKTESFRRVNGGGISTTQLLAYGCGYLPSVVIGVMPLLQGVLFEKYPEYTYLRLATNIASAVYEIYQHNRKKEVASNVDLFKR